MPSSTGKIVRETEEVCRVEVASEVVVNALE